MSNGGGAIAPTVTDEIAASQVWDAVVVGAGPGGSAAAITLGRRGARVLLIDKQAFPRWKVCGCCLSPAAEAALDGLGLGGVACRHGGSELHTLDLASARAQARIPLHGGHAVSREQLDASLLERAIDAGAGYLNARATVTELERDHRTVGVQSPEGSHVLSARLLVLADGLVSALAPELGIVRRRTDRIGLGATLPAIANLGTGRLGEPGVISMTLSRHGYVGVVRLGDDRLNLAAAINPAYLRRHNSPNAAVASMLSAAKRPCPEGLARVRFTGTPALTRCRARVSAPRLLALGDSAAYVEPFTGEGISWSLTSGVAAGETTLAILEGRDTHEAWQGWFDTHLKPQHRRCAMVARALRAGPLADLAVHVLSVAPRLATTVARLFAGPAPACRAT